MSERQIEQVNRLAALPHSMNRTTITLYTGNSSNLLIVLYRHCRFRRFRNSLELETRLLAQVQFKYFTSHARDFNLE